MSNFWGEFFYVLGGKFNLNWIYLHKIFVTMYSIPYTRGQANFFLKILQIVNIAKLVKNTILLKI